MAHTTTWRPLPTGNIAVSCSCKKWTVIVSTIEAAERAAADHIKDAPDE